MRIVDAHLDLSHNAMLGHDVLRPAREQVPGKTIPTVGLPDLRNGGVSLVFATIFCMPAGDTGTHGYHNSDEARADAMNQLSWYQQQTRTGTMRWITSQEHLPGCTARQPGDAQPAVLLMEGADPLRSIDDLAAWFDVGLRIIGLAWRGTRYAGGTGMPGPLTAEGLAMVDAIDRLGIIHDASHLAEQSFWDLMHRSNGPVIASHSNCRSIVPTDRQLSDDMIRAIADRGGVIGINFFDKFLLPPSQYDTRRANLGDIIAHLKHVCDLIGDAEHVGLGTDMDGGLGRNEIPEEILTSADLPKIADALSAAGFDDVDVTRVLHENWINCLGRSLPSGGVSSTAT